MNRYQWQKRYSGVTRKIDTVWKFPPKCIVNIAVFVEWAKIFLPTYKEETLGWHPQIEEYWKTVSIFMIVKKTAKKFFVRRWKLKSLGSQTLTNYKRELCFHAWHTATHRALMCKAIMMKGIITKDFILCTEYVCWRWVKVAIYEVPS